MGGGEKNKGNKREKRNGEWGLRVWWEERGSGKERTEKKLKGKKTKLVLFVCLYCLVQNVEL